MSAFQKNQQYIFQSNAISHKYSDYAILKLYVPRENPELYDLYTEYVKKHNDEQCKNQFFNSGFDLFIAKDETIESTVAVFVNQQVKAEMISCDGTAMSYYMYPRSSMSKTPLMLANHVGIIDSGYRGNLICALRNLGGETEYVLAKHTRLMQICAPTLKPIYVIMVGENELTTTERGAGGFGSTGGTA